MSNKRHAEVLRSIWLDRRVSQILREYAQDDQLRKRLLSHHRSASVTLAGGGRIEEVGQVFADRRDHLDGKTLGIRRAIEDLAEHSGLLVACRNDQHFAGAVDERRGE